jgi:hypothetical protein
MFLSGEARIENVDDKWLAYPLSWGAGSMLAVPQRWSVDVTSCMTAIRNPAKGQVVRVDVCVDSPCPWTNATPDGIIAKANKMVELVREDIGNTSPYTLPSAGDFVPPNLDFLVDETVRRMPRWWPIFEIEQSRHGNTGWHTRVHTLTATDDTGIRSPGLSPQLFQVIPWLTRSSW